METRTIHTLEALEVCAQEIVARLLDEKKHILALSGDLGVGKTAFVKKVGKYCGVAEEITSPTFVVMKSYAIPAYPPFKTLTHIDAYRIESNDEMRVLGFAELCADHTRLIALEWPERIKDLVPEDVLQVQFELQGEVRTITF